MRRLLVPALLVPLLLSAPALAVDTYLGTIVSSGSSTTNLTTATPFNMQYGWRVSVQCDAAVYVTEALASASLTVTSTSGLRIEQYALFDVDLTDPANSTANNMQLGVLPVSGSANCKVYRALP